MKALKAATQLLLLLFQLLLLQTGHACGTFIEIQAKRAGGKRPKWNKYKKKAKAKAKEHRESSRRPRPDP